MAIKLNDLNRWHYLAVGEAIKIAASEDQGRKVRLHVNCAEPTTFYVETAAGGPRLLAHVPAGVETIEFYEGSALAFFAGEGSGEVHYQTAELEPSHTEPVEPRSFTKLLERRARNPELEAIQRTMFLNEQARAAQQRAEMDAFKAQLRKELEDARQANPAPAVVGGSAPEVPAPVAPANGTGVAPAAG